MDRGEILNLFLDQLSVSPYPFQEEALLAWFDSSPADVGTGQPAAEVGGILASAPTGMGKTLIAEAALFEALHTKSRVYYTSPLIALTDQKFREFQGKAEQWGFPRESVGLITGNRRENPDAPVLVVVAEILLNHLLGGDERLATTQAVVMDEFHYFNDQDRGIVWELSLVLLPRHVRLLLLSATVGNAVEFIKWLQIEHGRTLRLIQSRERRIPLEFGWVGDQLPTDFLQSIVSAVDEENRTPALVFCFNRDECWEVAERLKGLPLVSNTNRAEIEKLLPHGDFLEGIGPKLKQMLIRGVGVHHAGVLPKHKEVVENLFLKKLIPYVICTETLAAGVNLPARSVVLTTLLKGKRGQKKLVPSSTAHQIFGRAGRPQFDSKGYVFAFAHEDDIRIEKWRKRYNELASDLKDPGKLRMIKEHERKKPSRRKTEEYWSEGQFRDLIKASPGDLASRSMIPYQVLVYLLTRTGTLNEARTFLGKRFAGANKRKEFLDQFDHMINNLAALGYMVRSEDGDHVTVNESMYKLAIFRSVDPIYGAFLCEQLNHANLEEKVLALESVLPLPPVLERNVRIPDWMAPGTLQQRLVPELVTRGLMSVSGATGAGGDEEEDDWDDEDEEYPPTFPEMLNMLFQSRLVSPEEFLVQPKWAAGAVFEMQCDFYDFVKSYNLTKQEGLILRHLLRLVILAGEFLFRTEDPDYQTIGEMATKACHQVDPRYTDRFLAEQEAVKSMLAKG